MKKALPVLVGLAILLGATTALPMDRVWSYSRILTTGAPAPSATITVRNAGTATLSMIFSDNLSTPKANPFLADSDGYWFFYAANGRYDVTLTGGGITTPYTLSDLVLLDSTAVSSLCGVTGASVALSTGTSGTDLAWDCNDTTDTITLNLPNASATARGLVSTGAQTLAGVKTFSTPIAPGSGGTGLDGSAAANGKLLIGNGTGFALASLASTTDQTTVTTGAGTLQVGTVQSIATTSSPTFASLTVSGAIPLFFSGYAPASGGGGVLRVNPSSSTTPVELTDGQVLIGQTGSTPQPATIGAGGGIAVASGAGTLTISNSSSLGGLSFSSFPTQTFAISSSGTDLAWGSANGIHMLQVPSAGASARGVVTTDAQTFAGWKTFTSGVYSVNIVGAAPATGADQPGQELVLAPGPATGNDVTPSVKIYVGRARAAGTTQHEWQVLEEWQGGTVADPVTDEILITGRHQQQWIRGYMEEEITLSLLGTTTDSTNFLLPANSIIEAAATRITAGVIGVGITGFQVGATTGSATKLCATSATVSLGATQVCFNGIISGNTIQTAADTVRITMVGGTPTAGKVRVVVWYRRFVAPAS